MLELQPTGSEFKPSGALLARLAGDEASISMPRPLPALIGYDGMPPVLAGIAMKAEAGRWVPVARFDPPLSEADQARANEMAERAYAEHVDRVAELAVNGAVA